MGIKIRLSKKEELRQLEHMEEASFEVNSKYFENKERVTDKRP